MADPNQSQTPTQQEYDRDQAGAPQTAPTPAAPDTSLEGWTAVEGTQKAAAAPSSGFRAGTSAPSAAPTPDTSLEGWTAVQGTAKPVSTPATPEKPGYVAGVGESVGLPTTAEQAKAALPGYLRNIVIPGFGLIESAPSTVWDYAKKTVGDIQDAMKEQQEAAQNYREGGPFWANLGKGISGVVKAGVRQIPFVGEPAYQAGEEIAAGGNAPHAAGLLTGVIAQVAIPEILAKTSLGGRLESAVKTHANAKVVLESRAKELDTASSQAWKASTDADAARAGEKAGTVTTPARIEAENNASAALANASKAQRAVDEAQTARNESAVKVNNLVQKAVEKHQKANAPKPPAPVEVGTPEEIEKSKKDFQKSIPPSPGRAAYTDEDQANVRPILEASHRGTSVIDSPQDVVDALESNRVSRDNEVRGLIREGGKYANEPLLLTDEAGKPVSVKQKLVEALAEDEKVRPGFTEEALKQLDRFNTTDPTLDEADRLRETLNSENRDKLNTPQGRRAVADARETDPTFAATYELQDILRDGIYGKLEEKGVKGARESRNLDASVIRVKNAAEKQARNAEKVVRGTSDVGGIRKAAAKASTIVGAGAGAGLGAMTGIPMGTELGGAAGAAIGRGVGNILAPPDLTRGALLKRSMDVNHGVSEAPRLDVTGAQPSNPPTEPTPGTPFSEHMIPELQKLRGESTVLHGDLATHYGENLGDTPYSDLEGRFLSDVATKRTYGVPLDAAEKKLLAGINQAKVDEALQVRGMAEEQRKAKQKAAEEAAKQKTEAGLSTNLAAPFETEPHLRPEDENNLHHELGHHFQQAKAGHPTHDIIGDGHKKLSRGAEAEARWNPDAFLDDKGNVNLDYLRDNIGSLLDIFHGGAVADEVMHGTPVHKNAGAATDLRRARTKLIEAGFSPSEAGQLMAASESRVRKDFTTPGVRDIFQKYGQAREAGLDDGLLMSPEVSGRAIQEFKNALESGNETDNKPTPAGKGERGNKPGNAGRAGGVQAGSKEGARAASAKGEGVRSAGAGELRAEVKAKAEPKEEMRVPFKEGRTVPPERTSGKYDEAIKAGGGIPGGVEAGDIEADVPDMVLFHDPTTGSTLYMKADEVTPESVKKELQKSRSTYLKATPEESRVPKPGQPGYDEAVHGGLKTERNIPMPKERSTGVPEHDAAIKEGGGIPGGVSDFGEFGKIYNFHDPQTGSTLGFKEGKEITPETVKSQLEKSREAFATVKAKKGPLAEEDLSKAADAFNKAHGRPAIDTKPTGEDARSSQVADAYKNAVHNPNDPAVKASYDALKRDVKEQYHLAQKLGIKMDVKPENPYGLSGEKPAHEELHDDVRKNKHLSVWSGGAPPADHPLSEVDPETGHTYNELFRMVHDIFGHTAEHTDFTPSGEEHAWNLHRQMFSPEARPALATETKGQAAYTYKYGDLPPQKAAILPTEYQSPVEGLKTNKAAVAAEPKTISDRLIEKYGESKDPLGTGFIMSDGRRVDFGANDHIGAVKSVLDKDEQNPNAGEQMVDYLNNEKAIRTRYRGTRAGKEVVFSVPKDGVSEEQISQMRQAVGKMGREGNVVMETAEGFGKASKSAKKEFALPSDVDSMLREIGAHPETATEGFKTNKAEKSEPEDWAHGVANNLETAPAGGINPQNPEAPSKRYGFEIMPEARKPLMANPTAQDLQSFASEHGDKLGLHPDIKLGWDTTKEGKPELNIGATTNDLDTAKTMAKKLDQRDLWDNEKKEVIPVGGEGKKTAFPEYPLEQRLDDLGLKTEKAKPVTPEVQKKAEDQTTVSPEGSSVKLRDNPLKIKSTGEGDVPLTTDVAKALNNFTKKSIGSLELDKSEPAEMVARAKSLAEDEAKYQMAQNNNGAAWYTTDMAKHDEIAQGQRPELKDPAKMSIFKMGEAILSSGQKPYGNYKAAIRAWDHYQETGKFSPVNPDTRNSWGPRGIPAYGNAFESLNRLISEHGEQGASDWLLAEHPVKELREYNDNVGGKTDDKVPGALILGPKRGPFAQNLHGLESAFTADMWVSRTWNRWMGTTEFTPDGEIATDSPRSGRERKLMQQSFKETADKMGMTTSSLQAVLWYYEQALYHAHGSPKESWSFSNAAQRAADEEASTFDFGANVGKAVPETGTSVPSEGTKSGLDILAGKR